MKAITDRVLGFDTAADREAHMRVLAEDGWNHFVWFRDTQSDFALMYGFARWCSAHPLEHDVPGPIQVTPRNIYVNR